MEFILPRCRDPADEVARNHEVKPSPPSRIQEDSSTGNISAAFAIEVHGAFSGIGPPGQR
jgi:hypothetical protein